MKNFVSINTILDRVKQHPLMHELTFEEGVRGVVDCIRLIGVPVLFDYKYKEIPITDYKGSLPDDFIELDMESSVRLVTGTSTNKTYYPMISTTSIYTNFSDKIEPNKNSDIYDYNMNRLKYTIKGTTIIIPIEEAVVDIVYKGLYLDEDKLPKIPDNIKVVKAIEFYLKSNHFRILADLGKINERTAEAAERDYTWYVGAAQTDNLLNSIDDRQAISNLLTNIFIHNRDHSTFFENVGVPEKLRRNI